MNKYDVIIVGGGTAGCACAYIAAKLGLKVLVVEKNSFLGGSITSALVIPAMKTSENAINNEFYEIFYKKLYDLNGAITYSDGNKGWFNPELTKIVLDDLLISSGVDIRFESCISKINENLSTYIVTIQSNNTYMNTNNLSLSIEAKYIVDATGDAKICEKLNCKFLENNFSQPINLRFIMSGINTKKFIKWIKKLDKDRNVTTSCTVEGIEYCSTAYTWDTSKTWALKPIFTEAVKAGILKEEDTNYFQIFSVAGTKDSIAFNAPRLLSQYNDISQAYIDGRSSILRLSEFCKKYLPGFEDSYISSIANSLGIRVSNCVKGKYVYTQEDLRSGKQFAHPVVISNYPIDVHSSQKDSSKLEKVLKEYQLPLESLIVRDNLFVIGRCISADFESQAALRIIPSCFSMGEGLARYLASKNC